MAWIKSYQELERHPKTLQLMSLMGWDVDVAISKLHRLWWWCLDYAENGELTKYTPEVISKSVGVESKTATHFIDSMCSVGFFDKEPTLRIHDWWDYAGGFLITRHKRHPEKWQAIKSLYSNSYSNSYREVPDKIRKDKKEQTPCLEYDLEFKKIWEKYPSKTGVGKARERFIEKVKSKEDLDLINKCLEIYLMHLVANSWKKPQNGSTWFNNWRDWVDFKESEDVVKTNGPKPFPREA